LNNILSGVQQQVAQRTAQQHGSNSSSSVEMSPGYDAAVAAKWAAANPPGSCGCCSSSSSDRDPSLQQQDQQQDQQQQSEGVAGSVLLCVHYYSPAAHAQLSEVYNQARALLQPTPHVVEPPKKGTNHFYFWYRGWG
jgi:hypothetical protein